MIFFQPARVTALALARPHDAQPGADNLALFYIEPRKPDWATFDWPGEKV